MVNAIKWTGFAFLDLEQIGDYVAKSSPANAARFVRRIRKSVKALEKSPERAVVPELNDLSIREIRVGSYRVIYQIRTDAIYILRVIHGARDFESAWEERPTKPR